MRSVRFAAFVGITAVVAMMGAGVAWSEDAEAVIKTRQDTMKAQSKALAAVKAFVEGKGELAAAQAAGPILVADIGKIPGLFPPKTGMAEFPGKSWAKPEVWGDHAKFLAEAKTAEEKAKALEAALKSGDKGKIEAAFADMGKNGCAGCHTPFREKKPA